MKPARRAPAARSHRRRLRAGTRRRRPRARSSIGSLKSVARTRAPSSAMRRVNSPFPQAISSTSSPGAIREAARRRVESGLAARCCRPGSAHPSKGRGRPTPHAPARALVAGSSPQRSIATPERPLPMVRQPSHGHLPLSLLPLSAAPDPPSMSTGTGSSCLPRCSTARCSSPDVGRRTAGDLGTAARFPSRSPTRSRSEPTASSICLPRATARKRPAREQAHT